MPYGSNFHAQRKFIKRGNVYSYRFKNLKPTKIDDISFDWTSGITHFRSFNRTLNFTYPNKFAFAAPNFKDGDFNGSLKLLAYLLGSTYFNGPNGAAARCGHNTIRFHIGDSYLMADGERIKCTKLPDFMEDQSAFVPYGKILKAFGYKGSWNSSNHLYSISQN